MRLSNSICWTETSRGAFNWPNCKKQNSWAHQKHSLHHSHHPRSGTKSWICMSRFSPDYHQSFTRQQSVFSMSRESQIWTRRGPLPSSKRRSWSSCHRPGSSWPGSRCQGTSWASKWSWHRPGGGVSQVLPVLMRYLAAFSWSKCHWLV